MFTRYVVEFVKHGTIESQIKVFETDLLKQSWMMAHNFGEDFAWFLSYEEVLH